MKCYPEVSEEMEKGFSDLFSEELKLKKAKAKENQKCADMALLEAKKMASQFQKEADKCNSGMETCEEAREKADAALEEQRRVTEMCGNSGLFREDGRKARLGLMRNS